MRPLLFVLLALTSLPCVAQERVFRASVVDAEQDLRLDSVESRVASLEASSQPSQAALIQTSTTTVVSKPVVAKPAKPYAVITIESIPGCPPCERWKAKEARELRAQGWTVVETSLSSSSSAPFFRICIGDKCYSHSGFMSHSVLRSILGKAAGGQQDVLKEGVFSRFQQATAQRSVQRQTAVSPRYTTDELRSMIHQARPGGWRGPIYADVSPRSMAKQHLVGPEHGFSWEQVSGLSQDEALILHDLAPRHGNQIFPTRH